MVAMIRSDLDFILAQIRIAEADARGVDLVASGLIPNPELPWGLRRVDGSNNNLVPGQGNFGAADQPFPHLLNGGTPLNQGDDGMRFGPPIDDTPGPGGTPINFGFLTDPTQPASLTNPPLPHGYIPTYATFLGLGVTQVAGGITTPNGTFIPTASFNANYLTNNNFGVHNSNSPSIIDPRALQPGDVVDADPRLISNLVADQTLNNPAAVFKALQIAEAADPFTAMQTIMTAVAVLKDARADLVAAQAAGGVLAPAIAAYASAATAAQTLMTTLAPAVDTTTSALIAELNNGATATAADVTALALAQGQINLALLSAQSILATLNGPATGVAAADKTAVQNFINVINDIKSRVDSIAITEGGVIDFADTLAAAIGEAVGNLLPAQANALDAQLDTSLASFGVSTVGAAQIAVDNATAALNNLVSPFHATTNPTGLTADGLVTDNTPGNTNILKETLFIGNVAPDAGLSSPFNGFMTLFGQFFDHGLDLVEKGGFGTVYIPLAEDDPLFVVGGNNNFMPVTRVTLDANGNATNLVTPFVDQNQTYTSNASAQVFHREYEMRFDATLGYDVPHATGRLLNGADGGLATWKDVKDQARDKLGIELDDHDIHSIPQLLVDDYGNFIRGANGFAQIVTGHTVAGLPITAGPTVTTGPFAMVPVDADLALKTGHAFLDDIAHNANPGQFDANPLPGPNNVNMQDETADGDTNISTASGPPQAAGTYDNELLDRHFITGDGRGNENIGLTAVHHVFHSEHNRQIDLIKDLVLGEAQAAEAAALLAEAAALAAPADLALAEAAVVARNDAIEKLAFLNEWTDVDLIPTNVGGATTATVVWDGERLFQGAKFPTEMQYQHLVFEEFARTVQPFVNVFNDFDGQLNPAIVGEFAHTVYRFGHSMLTETVDRLTLDNQQSIGTGGVEGAAQIGLIEAFLNPVEFNAGGMTADEAAGAIARGMTRQRGNEIDEFVTEALRNNLVGLPLDLAAINIARGRETNVPTLNEAREQFYAGSSDAQVKPYASWAEFAANLKNPASIINFIAAYGLHDSIEAATTAADKREAATKLVLGDITLTGQALIDFNNDRLDFLHHRGIYGSALHEDFASRGGLNDVDLWIGGLAEKQMAFGGMLGTTFNFVFEVQMEQLQDGDRFYYLSRLANLNLTAALENNKFAEMIARNTDASHLPGNVFKAMDFQLEVNIANQADADPLGSDHDMDPFLGGIVNNQKVFRVEPVDADPNNEYTNYLRFAGGEHVVLGGTDDRDILIADEGDDTLWGDGGDDRLDGGIGNDFYFGGEGADIITDVFGDDEIRSQGGDDVVGAGQGFNLIITDTGNDFVWAGMDLDEILLGQGNDFGAGGAGEDMIIGGEGNDWIETGSENGLFLGDNGDLVQGLPIKRSVDSPIIGHDILIATGGNADFDAETGDDIMVGGLGTDRFFGAFGFDWASYKNDDYGIEADMNVRQFAPPAIAGSPGAILDRYAQTEGLSGSRHIDFLRGDNVSDLSVGLPGTVTSLGLASQGLDDALKDENLDLIEGLRAFLAPTSGPGSNAGEVGVNAFSTGNILLGGQGSDVIEGRGGNDLIDGDRWLDVVIRVTPDATRGQTFAAFEVQGMADIQQRMFSGEIKVAQLEMVRRIVGSDSNNVAVDVDVAQFSGRRANYLVEGLNNMVTGGTLVGSSGFAADMDGDGFVTVRHVELDALGNVINVGPDPADDNIGGLDGTDRLKNVERLFFSDETIKANSHANSIATGAVNVTANTMTGELTASLTGAALGNVADADGFDVANVTFIWQVEAVAGSGIWTNINRITADEFSPVTGLTFTPTAAEAGLGIRVLARFEDNAGAVEHVASAPLNGVSGVNARPVYDEPNAILGPDLAGTNVDGEVLPVNSFGILEDETTIPNAPFVFSLRDVWINRFDPTSNTLLATDPNDTINDTVTVAVPNEMTVRERDGAGTVGTVVEVNPADPWTLPNPIPGGQPLPNLAKLFAFNAAPNFEGTVVFEFNITDGVTELVPAEATLDVFAVNDAPVAATNTGNLATIAAGTTTFTFTAAQLIGNATDIDGDQIRLVRSPDPTLVGADQFVTLADETQGTIVLNPDGSFTFTAAPGVFGPVVLNYAIEDGIATVATTATFTMGRTFVGGNASDGTLATPILGTIAADLLDGNGGVDVLSGGDGGDTINGGSGNDTLNGDGGADLLNGGANSDVVNGGAGNDIITYYVRNNGLPTNFDGGRDIINGGEDNIAGTGDSDTFVLNGNTQTEAFRIYTRDAWISAAGTPAQQATRAGQIAANTEIVITRGGGPNPGNNNVIAELDNIEEIVVNALEVSQTGGPVGGAVGGDTVAVIGDFISTSLDFSTITVHGTSGNDNVDLSNLQSPHRIVFHARGGSDTLTGTLRPQDVIVMADGTTVSGYTSTLSGGVTTLTNGTNSISFRSTGTGPTLLNSGDAIPTSPNDPDSGFVLSAADLAGLRGLITGNTGSDDDIPTGVRDLSGLADGVPNDQFIRLTDAHFGANGAINPLFRGLDPRNISNILGTQEAELANNAAGLNTFFMAFGQYFDHGLDFITKGGNGNILIDGADVAHGSSGTPSGGSSGTPNFADLTRAKQFGMDADGEPIYQNQTSPFVDQNQAYGSHRLVGQFLRESDGNHGFGSRLLLGAADPNAPGHKLLPTLRELIKHHVEAETEFANRQTLLEAYPTLMNSDGTVNAAAAGQLASNFLGSGHNLLLDANRGVSVLDHYIAGDGRVNENIALTSMHTIWARNHDFHVDNLVAQGFRGTPEEVFQAAKMINEAEYQRVVFTEFADALLGGMRGDGDHGFNGHNPDADPRISHEFASAAYRFGHSLISDSLSVREADGTVSSVLLKNAFLNPGQYASFGAGNILAGIAGQQAEEVDFRLVNAVRNDLVGTKADLFAFNVARGWDVGLGTLNQVRAGLANSTDAYVSEARGFAGNLYPYTSWEDFQSRNHLSDDVINQFREAYPDLVLADADLPAFRAANPDIVLVNGNTVKGIDRVELWVGGLAEEHINGGQVGQTFWVVLHEQFDRLQEADPFYYAARFDGFDFYDQELENTTFSEIVARNTGLTGLGENIFLAAGTDEDGADDGDAQNEVPDQNDGDGGLACGTHNPSSKDKKDEVETDVVETEDNLSEHTAGSASDENAAVTTTNTTTNTNTNTSVTNTTTLLPHVMFAGTAANDAVFGDEGNDRLAGGDGNDTVFGEGGDDNIVAGNGGDTVFAGEGQDRVLGDAGADMLFGDGGDDEIWGGDGRDVLSGGAGNDVIFAMPGDGNDDIDGGDGIDTLNNAASHTATVFDLLKGVVVGDDTGTDTVTDIENVIGGRGNDTFYANNLTNVMAGGAGDDTFVFKSVAAADGDSIEGFHAGDRISLGDMFGNKPPPVVNEFTAAGQIRLVYEDGDTRIEGNTGGDLNEDFSLLIKGYQVKSSDIV